MPKRTSGGAQLCVKVASFGLYPDDVENLEDILSIRRIRTNAELFRTLIREEYERLLKENTGECLERDRLRLKEEIARISRRRSA